ncbi:hypothetical protein M2165_004842 [Variovorax sp. TBS-050B]|uniref:TylF/MycF family methyltransferase n=1 Tax=Variovorax sp. TBS-050B TaxID=2940551 RepID=UPI002473A3B9|nr:TylF/MycF family methyltransferase [Variovorax sp. TBS-050B]MDH6594953.1 hypothetical protein [Variovorax sp. TBS-050B]
MRTAAKRLALTIPPLRRLYEFAMFHAHGHTESQRQLHELQQTHSRALEEARRQHEKLELQLYVMRSDHQRAAVRNEALSIALSELETQVAKNASFEKFFAQMSEKISSGFQAQQESLNGLLDRAVSREDQALAQSKLFGQLAVLTSEVARIKRPTGGTSEGLATIYLNLLEDALTGILWNDAPMDPWSKSFDPSVRAIGRDWPSSALTMIGSARLRNFRMLIEQAISERIPGDILEAGVWRGGACILARAVLAAHDVRDRRVWVADSFAGLPPPDPKYPSDAGDQHSTFTQLQVTLEEVQQSFRKYGLLDEQVCFLKGWFKDTLPRAPIEALSVLRLDGDMYGSTIETLEALYAKVSVGGYVIIDDYILEGCKQAVHDFRRAASIEDELQEVDGAAVYWKKTRA